MDLFFDNEFRSLLPVLTSDERLKLEESLKANGNLDPIIIWKEKRIVIDGHNRYDICQKYDIPLKPPTELSFPDKNAVKVWMITHQIGKRNLNDYQRSVMALKLEELLKPIARENQGVRNDIQQNSAKSFIPVETRKEIAKVAHVSHDTISKVKTIEAKATPEQKVELTNGHKSINAVYQSIRNEEKRQAMKFTGNRILESLVNHKTDCITLEQWNTLDTDSHKKILNPSMNGSKPSFNQQDNDSIEWAQWSWNPVTGCNTGCKYCYARDIAERFYTQKFKPSIYPQRLLIPAYIGSPVKSGEGIGYKNVFTCSMSDLFGPWVPTLWVDAVMDAIRQSPNWNYLLLSKWPENMVGREYPDNVWLGTTVDCQARVEKAESAFRNIKASVKFVSCEPLSEDLTFSDIGIFDWVLIGGRSRTSQVSQFFPPREWIAHIEKQARAANCKIFEKSNLLERIKEYPGGG